MRAREIIRLPLFCLMVSLVAVLLLEQSSADSIAQTRFDHFTTGFRLEGAHRSADCEVCHTDGVFAGTPTQCADCHTQASRIRGTWQPPTHLLTTDRCDSCHRAFAWVPVARFDHLETQGTCSSCHNNLIVAGQHPQHTPTTAECDTCHNSRFWRQVRPGTASR